MIYMMSCTRGPVTECTLHANLTGLRVLRTGGVSRLQSGPVSWEDTAAAYMSDVPTWGTWRLW